MSCRKYNAIYHILALLLSAGIFAGIMGVFIAFFKIPVFDNLTLLFNEPTEFGDWEVVEEIDGVQHVYSSEHGDNPKEVLSPFSYWLMFRGGGSIVILLFAGIFSLAFGHIIISRIFGFTSGARTVFTRMKNHSMGEYVDDYVEDIKEGFKARQEPGIYIGGKKIEKGDRKSIIRLIVFLAIFAIGILILILVNVR